MQLLPGSKPFPVFTIFLPHFFLCRSGIFDFRRLCLRVSSEILRGISPKKLNEPEIKIEATQLKSFRKMSAGPPSKKAKALLLVSWDSMVFKRPGQNLGEHKVASLASLFWKDLEVLIFWRPSWFNVLFASGQWTPGRHPQTVFDLCEKWFIHCHQTFFDSRFKIVKLQNRAIRKVTKGLILFAFPLEVTNNPLEI